MKRVAAWIFMLALPITGFAAEPALDTAPAGTQATNDARQTSNAGLAVPGRRCQAAARGSTNTPGYPGGRRWGGGAPPYGAGYETRRQWQGGGPGPGRGMGRNGGRGVGCGR